jgi:hypothetical protein
MRRLSHSHVSIRIGGVDYCHMYNRGHQLLADQSSGTRNYIYEYLIMPIRTQLFVTLNFFAHESQLREFKMLNDWVVPAQITYISGRKSILNLILSYYKIYI